MMLFKLILWIIIFWLLYTLVKKTFRQLFVASTEEESEVKGRKQETEKLYNPDDVVDVKYEEIKDTELKKEENKDE